MNEENSQWPAINSLAFNNPESPENFIVGPSPVDNYSRFLQSHYRGVRIGSYGFVLEPTALFEILESAKVSPIPGITSICKGLVNHHGNVVPVYDLAELAGTKPSVWERERLLILNSGESAVGIILYSLPVQIGTAHRIENLEITDIPDIVCRHVSAAYWYDDTYWLILDRESFFAELSVSCV